MSQNFSTRLCISVDDCEECGGTRKLSITAAAVRAACRCFILRDEGFERPFP
jgi:hypothetical protein